MSTNGIQSIPRDPNHVPVIAGISLADGITPVSIWADNATHRLLVNATVSGSAAAGQYPTATVTSVAGSASNVTLLASNSSRREAIIYNDSTAILYLKEGITATTSSYTFQLQPNDVYITDVYTGQIDGIWASATGSARITEG